MYIILGRLNLEFPDYLDALIALPLSILLSSFMYEFVEKPSLVWAALYKD